MDLSLRPATVEALQRFRARHNALLWRRAGLMWLALGIATLLVIALLDRAFLLPEVLRPWCSLAVYLGSLIAAWKMALRFLQPAGDRQGSARLAETAAPEVREKLLAAVELSQQDPAAVNDSVEFRARLQDEVAAAVQVVDWRQRLPATVLKPWGWRLVGAVVVAIALSFVPKLHLPGFLARAALPFANLERPSSVKIEIEAPTPASGMAPIASEVNVAARITGQSVDQAFIEYGELTASTRRMELGKVSPERFEGRLPVGQADVRYRIRASDGLTAWHTLSARARPRLTQFVKTIVSPAYAGATAVTLTEDHGDLEVLEGSTVKLAMQANQPIQKARIVLNPDMPTHPTAPEITVQDQGRLAAVLTVDGKAEAWTVQLTSAETGFSNDEAASWRITVVPDLPPLAQIIDPPEQQVSLLPDESVRISGTASDDVGLKSVQLAQALNGEDWKTTPLPFKPGKEAAVQHLLAMAPLHVKAGDTLLIKLIATDLKGQKAESAPLRILILEQTVDPAKRAWAAETRRLAEMAKTLEEKTRDVMKAMATVQKVARQEKLGKPVTDDAHAQLARVKQQIERANEQAANLWEQLKKAAQVAPTRLNGEEARLLGEKVAQLRHDSLHSLEENTRDGVENPEVLKRNAALAASLASTVHEAAKTFATEDTARITQQATEQIARQQALLTETSLNGNRDQSQRPKWQEQQRAALAASAQLKTEFTDLKQQVQGGTQAALERMQKDISEAAADLNESLDKPDSPTPQKDPQPPQPKSPEHLYGASDNLHQRLARSAEAIRAIADDASRKASDMRQRLQAQDNPALAAIDQAKVELQQAAQAAKAPVPPRGRPKPKDGLNHEERAEQQLAQAAKQLQDQGELREQNPLTNTQAALDANRASRAAEKLQQDTAEAAKNHNAAALEAVQAKAADLVKITRTLDADQLAQEATAALAEAASQQPPAGNERDDLAKNAEAAHQAADQLKQLPQALRRAEAAADLAVTAQLAADQARNAAQQLQDQQRQAAQRQPNQPVQPAPRPASVAEAQTKAQHVADALAPQAEGARQQLAALAPKVSEMMHQVAKDLRETQKETEAAKMDADAKKPVEEVAQKAQDIQPEAGKNAEKMNTLQAALRQEANAAQLAKADQRQLARTADVALEQMRQKSPEIAQNLKQAAKATQSQPQAQSLQKAAQAQQQTADALQKLADNFAKMEKGEEVPQDALAQLEQMEKDLGVEQPLDEAYDKAKELADVSQDAKNDPQKALAELEKQLHKSPAMQKALAEIAKDTAQKSEHELTAKANQPGMLGTVAEDAGNNLERVARHEDRLGQKDAAKQVKDASTKVNATAKATKTEPGNATPQVAQETTAAAQAAAKSAEQAAAATPAQPNISPFAQTQAKSLAKALDELDAQLHPVNGGQQQQQAQQGQQGAQQPPQKGQQGAQQSMAQAQKSQQQSMAQDRAQGKVPGQQQSQQQTAQGKGQAKPDSSQSPEEGGNFANTPGKEGVMVPVNVVVDGNWGKLPARMAEDLNEATRQEAAPEYRAAIENYYKAIASKAKK